METQAVPQEHYVWTPPSGEWRIRLSFNALDSILQDVLRGFGAVPKRGAEVGGLLLGSVDGHTITIDGHESVPCDYKLGPSYVFTAADRSRLEAAIRSHREAGTLVGYYRSDTREDLRLSAEDIDWLDRRFSEASAVALLIRPFATKVSQAGFFLRSADGRFPSSTPLDFPFSRKLLGGGSKRRERDYAPEPAVESSRPAGAAGRAEIPVASSPSRGGRGFWAAALILATSLGWGAGFFSARQLPLPPDPNRYRLALRAELRNDDLRLVWDKDSPALATANRGRLKVREGSLDRTIPLDLELLRQGLVIYRNPPGPVRFELEVDQIAGSTVREAAEFPAAAN